MNDYQKILHDTFGMYRDASPDDPVFEKMQADLLQPAREALAQAQEAHKLFQSQSIPQEEFLKRLKAAHDLMVDTYTASRQLEGGRASPEITEALRQIEYLFPRSAANREPSTVSQELEKITAALRQLPTDGPPEERLGALTSTLVQHLFPNFLAIINGVEDAEGRAALRRLGQSLWTLARGVPTRRARRDLTLIHEPAESYEGALKDFAEVVVGLAKSFGPEAPRALAQAGEEAQALLSPTATEPPATAGSPPA